MKFEFVLFSYYTHSEIGPDAAFSLALSVYSDAVSHFQSYPSNHFDGVVIDSFGSILVLPDSEPSSQFRYDICVQLSASDSNLAESAYFKLKDFAFNFLLYRVSP